jgi:urease accessory protein
MTPQPMAWHAKLQLHYTHDGTGTRAHDRHEGPLRVLQRLYPEGPAICHHVLVHPPGGIVGGDTLRIEARLDRNCHALITTPGATRFYRSAGESAEQHVQAQLADGARLEWLPLETIAYDACLARNHLRFELAPGAEMIGWDVLALGLPAAGLAFERGSFLQELQLPGAWLERGLIDAADTRLLDSALGWAGRRVLATMWFAAGQALAPARRDALLDAARAQAAASAALASRAGATAPQERVVVLRVLADRVEPVMQLLAALWAAWRAAAWSLDAKPPRLWRT